MQTPTMQNEVVKASEPKKQIKKSTGNSKYSAQEMSTYYTAGKKYGLQIIKIKTRGTRCSIT